MDDRLPVEAMWEDEHPPQPISRACSGRAAGEKAMLNAMLLDAIQCIEGQGCPKRSREQLARQARKWVVGREAGARFSFENVCAYLGLPADRLRASLLRLAADAARGPLDSVRRGSTAETRARAERNEAIRALRAAGQRPGELAERFGLSYGAILMICAPQASAPHVAA